MLSVWSTQCEVSTSNVEFSSRDFCLCLWMDLRARIKCNWY